MLHKDRGTNRGRFGNFDNDRGYDRGQSREGGDRLYGNYGNRYNRGGDRGDRGGEIRSTDKPAPSTGLSIFK